MKEIGDKLCPQGSRSHTRNLDIFEFAEEQKQVGPSDILLRYVDVKDLFTNQPEDETIEFLFQLERPMAAAVVVVVIRRGK